MGFSKLTRGHMAAQPLLFHLLLFSKVSIRDRSLSVRIFGILVTRGTSLSLILVSVGESWP